ncbi:MAG TPA: hypothetical protein VGX23_01225 [Actinocrinis sp.]|nr:hypothetical protein [Actinocrinis sp.]
MAGSSFQTDLTEMEAALLTINNLITDNFGDTAADLNQTPFQNGAASDIQQSALAGQIKRAEEADGGDSSFYGQFTEAGNLNTAHGQLLETLLELRATVEAGIQTLQTNLKATHTTYSSTETQIGINVSKISPMKVTPATGSTSTGK